MQAFSEGQRVLWIKHITGYRWEMRIKAEIIKLNPKTARIKAFKKDGSYTEHTAKYSLLIAEAWESL